MKLKKTWEELSAYERKFHSSLLTEIPENQIDKIMDYINKNLSRLNTLYDIINTTIDEKEFALSLYEITCILYSNLTPYEYLFDFKELPSEMLMSLYKNRSYYMDKLYERIKATYNFDNMEGHEFEYFCADLLRKAGYINIEVTQGSGDQGIDIIAFKDGIKYGIQCKCYSSNIGNKAVQEAYSGARYYDCHVPVVMTNRFFTNPAKELAEKIKVLLWDRVMLETLVNTYIAA